MLASRIKQAISPLGQDIDDDVFEYLGDLIKESGNTDNEGNLEEICSTYIPGFLDLSKQEKNRILNKLENVFKLNPTLTKTSSNTNTGKVSSSKDKVVVPTLDFSVPASDDIWNVSTNNTLSSSPSVTFNSSLNPQDILATLPSSFQNLRINSTTSTSSSTTAPIATTTTKTLISTDTKRDYEASSSTEEDDTTDRSSSSNNDENNYDKDDNDNNEVFTSEIDLVMNKVPVEQIKAFQVLFPHVSDVHSRFILGQVRMKYGGPTVGEGGTDTIVTMAAEYIWGNTNYEKGLQEIQANERKVYDERKKRQKEEKEKERKAKALILDRYDERIDDTGKVFRPEIPKEMQKTYRKGEKVLKYLDGKVIHMKPGEKYFVEETTQEYGTVHNLKIKKKGQGGKSPGFKK